ncbi:MAG: hypothetical protein AB1607_08195 [Chloroflexota bacterium]
MQPNDPTGLSLLYEVVRKNRVAGGCVIFLMRLTVVICGYLALTEIFISTVDENTATKWSSIAILGAVSLYLLITILRRIIHRRKN